MTRIFMAGAEAGTPDVFSSVTGTATASTAQKRTGDYSFYIYAGSATVVLTADKSVLYFRVGLYLREFSTWNGYPGTLIQLRDNVSGYQCSLAIDKTTGFLKVYRGQVDGGTLLGTGSTPVPADQWCCIEWYIKIADSSDGESTVKLNGVTEITITGADTKGTAVAGAIVVTYMTAPYSSIYGYLDDLAINDNAGAVNNSWVGRGGIYGIVPEGVGNYTDLIAQGHANPWDCISEVPPDDADYVYESTVDKKSTYALTALVPTTGIIACINVIMRAKLDTAGSGNIARLIRSNGVDSQGADVGLDTSPKTIQNIIEADPSGGGAWTIARVNALEAGAVVR